MDEYIRKDTARRIIDSPRNREQMLAMLEVVPSEDVQSVIRCKDCDSAECSGVMIYCLTHGCYMRDNDFCNYGEWKDDDTDG